MWKSVAGIVVVAVGAGVSASYFTHQQAKIEGGQSTAAPVTQTPVTRTVSQTQSDSENHIDYSGRKHRIQSDARGHYVTTARMNGRRVEVLVDTGATSVAINKSTARRLGIRLIAADFKHRVNTANGQVKAATAIIERIEIGRVSARNVQAAVLPDKSLKGTLLGMSFLNEMRSFEIRNGELVLTQ